jgi:hypothetical protein
MFSKFAFKMGKYDTMVIDENQSTQVKYYALKMALEGKRLNCTDLFELFVNETLKKD